MNEVQALHVKAIARHIREHASSIVSRMKALENGKLSDVSKQVAYDNFKDATRLCDEIYHVLRDMLPNMPVDEQLREIGEALAELNKLVDEDRPYAEMCQAVGTFCDTYNCDVDTVDGYYLVTAVYPPGDKPDNTVYLS